MHIVPYSRGFQFILILRTTEYDLYHIMAHNNNIKWQHIILWWLITYFHTQKIPIYFVRKTWSVIMTCSFLNYRIFKYFTIITHVIKILYILQCFKFESISFFSGKINGSFICENMSYVVIIWYVAIVWYCVPLYDMNYSRESMANEKKKKKKPAVRHKDKKLQL